MDVIGPILTVAGIAIVFLLGLRALFSESRQTPGLRLRQPQQPSARRPPTFIIIPGVRLIGGVVATILGVSKLLLWYGRRW